MKKLTPYLIPLSLLVIALSIFSLGYESKMGSEPMMGATTKIKLTDPNSVTPAATSTPTANMIPIADSYGVLDNFNSQFGNASSGTLSISAGTTTIDVGGALYYELNYEDFNITGTGSLKFVNAHASGTYVNIKVRGNFIVTSTASPAIDMTGMGATSSVNGLSNFGYPLAGSNGGAGGARTGGVQTTNITNNFGFGVLITTGSGGGDGAAYGKTAIKGSAGGGALVISVAGNFNFTGSIWSKGEQGKDRTEQPAGSSYDYGGGSGGAGALTSGGNSATGQVTQNSAWACDSAGGGGGSVNLRYFSNKLISKSGTIIVTGGARATAYCATTHSGIGGDGYYSILPF